MSRAIRLSLVLVVLLALLMGAVRFIALAQFAPLGLMFAEPDGTPCERACLFGIEPGQTSRTAVIELLRTHPLLTGDVYETQQDDGTVLFTAPGKTAFGGKSVVLKIAGYPIVRQVAIVIRAQPPLAGTKPAVQPLMALGDMMTFWGMPDRFVWGDYGGDWYFFRNYEVFAITNNEMQINMDGAWLVSRSPADKIISISISDAAIPDSLDNKWCGFSTHPHSIEAGCLAVHP